jgi:type I restriction enzyme S subunit
MLAENEAQGEWTLPDGWVWTTLGEITEPSKEKVNPQEIQRTLYIGLEHIEKDTGKLLGFGCSEEVRSTKAVFHRGDLLYGKLRPYLNKVYIADFDGICSTDILVFSRSPYVLNRYLLYRLLSADFVRYANLNVSGVQHPRTNFKILSQFPLAIPPAAEQRRIVAEIETQFTRLDAAVAALERAQANLRRYKASVLKAACEGRLVPTEAELARAEGRDYEPADRLLARILAERRARWEADYLEKQRAKGKEPQDDRWKQKYKEPALLDMEDLPELTEGWVWASLEQLSWQSNYGTSQKCTYEAQGPPVLRIPNIVNGTVELADLKYATDPDKLRKDDVLVPGDLLIIRTNGSRSLIGRGALIRNALSKPHFFASYLIRFRILEILTWLAAVWDAPIMREWLERSAATSAGQYNLNIRTLNRLPIPLAPHAEQRRIVAEVERRLSGVEALEREVKAALARARRLRQAVLKQAFEGRLVPQDPDDEPASVLLERIRTQRKTQITEEGKRKTRQMLLPSMS